MDTEIKDINEIAKELNLSRINIRDELLKNGRKIRIKLLHGIHNNDRMEAVISQIYYEEIMEAVEMLNMEVVDIDEATALSCNTVPFRLEPMIYFLFDGGVLVYIGQSINLCSRISQHVLDGEKRFDKVAAFSVPKKDLNMVEDINIYKYKPIYNQRKWSQRDYFKNVLLLCSFQ